MIDLEIALGHSRSKSMDSTILSKPGKLTRGVFFAVGLISVIAITALAEEDQFAYFLTVSGRINNNSERQNIGASFRGIEIDKTSAPTEKYSVSGLLGSVPGTRLAEPSILGYYPAKVVLHREGASGSEDRTYVKVRRRFFNFGVYSGYIRLKKTLKPYQPGRQRFRGRGVLRN